MQLLGFALLFLLILSLGVNLWFSSKIQKSLFAADRLDPLLFSKGSGSSIDVVVPAYNEENYIVECV